MSDEGGGTGQGSSGARGESQGVDACAEVPKRRDRPSGFTRRSMDVASVQRRPGYRHRNLADAAIAIR